ncbi:MAG TPA: TetR family transcriptional regulator [Trebonia sp.]|jgi:AcrR family transcriptional regulator|nr:TetR family transcriptional regulator [Trebonia sp.]
MTHGVTPGLRERKKARTRASLREHALRLFREQGYAATTVEQIAGAAEVSPSTFFRYFPTKEDVVIQDDFDTRIFEALERQPPQTRAVTAFRAALRDAVASLSEAEWAQLREASALQMTVPEIRARMFDDMNRIVQMMARALARRSGREPDDLEVQTFVGAVFGVMVTVTFPFHTGTESGMEARLAAAVELNPASEVFTRVDEALALLENGLEL